jgi:hypothetical protein
MSTIAVSTTEARAAYSPAEFSRLFGKSVTWAYRLIKRGDIESVTLDGALMIPASEVARLLEEGKEGAHA